MRCMPSWLIDFSNASGKIIHCIIEFHVTDSTQLKIVSGSMANDT